MLGSSRFADRSAAGRALADALVSVRLRRPVVLGLPRGGLPVAAEVARRLDAPLDVLVVRKVGAPSNPEYALGAVGEGGVEIIHDDAVRRVGIDRERLAARVEATREELDRRLARYRGVRPAVDVERRDVVIVDDGIATGATIAAATEVVRARGARRVVVAAPVAPAATVARLRERADDVVVLRAPERFRAVGAWYHDFEQVPDTVVVALLSEGTHR